MGRSPARQAGDTQAGRSSDAAHDPRVAQRPLVRWLPVWLGAWLMYLLAGAIQGTIALPPYEDQAVGLWSEADFLVETGFDYRRLRYEEPHFLDGGGGRRSYMVSLLPTLVAVLLSAAPTIETAILAYHVVCFAFAAVAVTAFAAILLPHVGGALTLLLSVALLTSPIFSVQVDLGGMDIPMAAGALLTIALVGRGNLVGAALASALCFAMKATGLVVTFALVLVLAARLVTGQSAAKRKRGGGLALVVTLAVLCVEVLLLRWGDTGVVSRSGFAWQNVLGMGRAAVLCPEIMVLGFALGMLGFWQFSKWFVTTLRSDQPHGWMRRLRLAVSEQLMQRADRLLLWLVLAGLTAGLLRTMLIPRYCTLAVPLLLLLLGEAALSVSHGALRKFATAGFGLLIAFQIANYDGRLLPDLEPLTRDWSLHPRSCALRERSHEYLDFLHSDVDAGHALGEQGADAAILTHSPYTYLFSRPRLGYVEAPLGVHDMGTDLVTSSQRFVEVAATLPNNAQLFAVWEAFRATGVPPPQSGDQILFDDELPSQLVVFTPSLPTAKSGAALLDWYVDHIEPNFQRRPEVWAAYLRAIGRNQQAAAALSAALRDEPHRDDLRWQYAELLETSGQFEAAVIEYELLLDRGSEPIKAHQALARLYEELGRLDAAREHARAASRLDDGG